MVHQDPSARQASKVPCIYWDGVRCIADSHFPEDTISCFHEANCDGFGTCRGCTKYDQGGMKVDTVDKDGGRTQTPLNLKLYNIRARIKPCCFWDGAAVDFEKKQIPDDLLTFEGATITGPVDSGGDLINGQIIITADPANFPVGFPPSNGTLLGIKEGTDESGAPFPTIPITYADREVNEFTGVSASPVGFLDDSYTISLAVTRRTPIFRPEGSDLGKLEEETKCTLVAAAPLPGQEN